MAKNDSISDDLLVEALDRTLEVLGYDDDEQIRVFRREDGREVLVVQANPFSVSRIYVTGRPDGKRIHGHDSYFDYIKARLDEYRARHETDVGFTLDKAEWARLFAESHDRYMRYLFFSGIHRWHDVERDTEANLTVCDWARRYADDETAWSIYQFKGYILMMNHIARAELALENGDASVAQQEIAQGIEKIGAYCRECVLSDHAEAEQITRENYLANMLKYREELVMNGRLPDASRADPRNVV